MSASKKPTARILGAVLGGALIMSGGGSCGAPAAMVGHAHNGAAVASGR
jgi:hypothetical protein